jgi:putative flippase GtrA
VDYSSYQALLAGGLWVHLAKALGFIAGTTTAYLINRRWTFQSKGGRGEFASVLALYGITFVVQVGMNAVMLALLPPIRGEITCAFIVAQGPSFPRGAPHGPGIPTSSPVASTAQLSDLSRLTPTA